MANADRKILIVGAGPAGLAAAVEFSRRGFRPRVVETKDGPVPLTESRALAINLRTLELLEPAGLSEKIVAEALQAGEMRLFDRDYPLARVSTAEVEYGKYRGMHILPQGRTQRLLLERLAGFGIVPEWRTSLERLTPSDTQPAATLLRADGAREEAAFDIVVGADGAHSTARREAGLSFAGEALAETFYLADYRYTQDLESSYIEAHFFNPGAIARFPVDRRSVRFVSTLADFRDRISHVAAIESVLWEAEFKVSFRHVERMSRGNVFLIGDAAHIHSPIGGRGMNLGIEDACWLAWLVSEGRESEFSDLRLPAVRMVVGETHGMTRMVLLHNPIALLLRNMSVPLLTHIPWFTRRMVASLLGLDTPPPPWLQ